MSAGDSILDEIARRGVKVRVDGQTLWLSPRAALDDDLLARIREHKPEIIQAVIAPPEDDYERRFRVALAAICQPDYPIGLIPWLGDTRPDLYAALTSQLPDEISRLWNEHAPLEEFDRVLGLWSETHRMGREVYGKRLIVAPKVDESPESAA